MPARAHSRFPGGERWGNLPRGPVCNVFGCPKPTKNSALGLCPMHYDRLKRNGDPTLRVNTPASVFVACAVEGCPVRAFCRGWCQMHYERWHRHGDPLKKLKQGRPKGSGLVERCVRGHTYTSENTRERGRGRVCRACDRFRQRARRQQQNRVAA